MQLSRLENAQKDEIKLVHLSHNTNSSKIIPPTRLNVLSKKESSSHYQDWVTVHENKFKIG